MGIRNNQIIDDDIDEALAIERKFDNELYEVARILSQ